MRQRKGAQPEPCELSKEEEGATSPEESPESRGFTRKQTAKEEFGEWREHDIWKWIWGNAVL